MIASQTFPNFEKLHGIALFCGQTPSIVDITFYAPAKMASIGVQTARKGTMMNATFEVIMLLWPIYVDHSREFSQLTLGSPGPPPHRISMPNYAGLL